MASEFNPQKAYESGLVGARYDPRASEEFDDAILRAGGQPDGGVVAHDWEWAGIGKDKLTATWVHVENQFPGCWPGPGQQVGDCFVAGTMVTMSDGTRRPIENVRQGDFVVSPTGSNRRVMSVFSKPYVGDLLSVSFESRLDRVECTPDHQFLSPVNDRESQWVPAAEMAGRHGLVPFAAPEQPREIVFDLCDYGFSSDPNEDAASLKSPARRIKCPPDRVRAKHSANDCPRFIALDDEFAWFIGLYLAEGSCDKKQGQPVRITLNLCSERRDLAERASQFLDRVGVKNSICSVPSKPTVLYVRAGNVPFATLLSKITGSGNTYTKYPPPEVFLSCGSVRESLVQGWFAGDGWVGETESSGGTAVRVRAVGVSVNRRLITDIQRLAASVGIHAAMTGRKAYKQSKAAYQLSASGKSAMRLMRPSTDADAVSDRPKVPRVSRGFAPKVAGISSRPWSGTVYCIEVEEDHAFIANGVAVHNCVSHGCKNCALTTLACELESEKPDEVTGRIEGKPEVPAEGIKAGVLSTEAIYWWRYERMGPRSMDGWTCPDAARHVTTNAGLWLRKDYPEFGFNLTNYSAGNIRKYLGRNPPDNVRDFGRQHLIRTATNVKGFEQVRDFLAAGYGVFFCSGVGWESTRNEDGVSSPRGSWAHSQALVGADDRPETVRKYGEPLICILNSWAKWNRGPRKVLGTSLEIPHGAYWTKASILSRMSCIALSSVAGWPRRKLPTYGAEGNL